MPEPIYGVKLFYKDMKFSNDYSNVLQFNTKENRDTYFDNISESFSILNTESNRVMFDGGSIKIAFPFNLDNEISNSSFDDFFDKINYCYIQFALVSGSSFEQCRKYYFVDSYEIVSSNENVTVVEFSIEYDVWQNNQFDFTIRESNIERMHVDRWNKNNGKMTYTRPVMDSIESNVKVIDKYQIEDDTYALVNHHDSTILTKIMWVMVSAIHSFGDKPDQMLYHFIPIIYDKDDLTYTVTSPSDLDYYNQNSIKVFDYLQQPNPMIMYFPSIDALDSSILEYACGSNTGNDTVKVINVQFFNWLPLRTYYGAASVEGHNVTALIVEKLDGTPLKLFYSSYRVGEGIYLGSYATGSLLELIDVDNNLTKIYSYQNISVPSKPTDGDNYSDVYEPALFMSPIRKRYISMGDVSAISEIPDIMYIKSVVNATLKYLTLHCRISFSSTSAYTYFTMQQVQEPYDRVSSNTEGFALIKPSFLGDILTDTFQDYVVQQRDSERAMMWTNIVTGGISEAGSTTVSAGIGWRSNMERAYSLANSEKFAKSQQRYYNNTPGAGHSERTQFYKNLRSKQLNPNVQMYKGMAKNAMMMSGIGGVTAFSANAIHQAMAQRSKERSIQNTPGTLAKSGNSIAAIIDNQFKMYYVETIVDDVAYEKYKIMFMKYGYYIGSVELPNINSRKYFNYIKTNGAIITGSCNQLLLSYIASIFDNGVTIWHMDYTTYETIYDYTKENIERSLM